MRAAFLNNKKFAVYSKVSEVMVPILLGKSEPFCCNMGGVYNVYLCRSASLCFADCFCQCQSWALGSTWMLEKLNLERVWGVRCVLERSFCLAVLLELNVSSTYEVFK